MRTRVPKQVIERFRRVPLFAHLSHRGLRAIAAAADELTEPAGNVLVREGEFRRELFVLAEGKAKVTRRGRRVTTLESGDFFGELSLLSGGPRTATVTAETDVSVMMLTPQQFEMVLQREPAVLRAVLKALGDRLQELQKAVLA